MKTLERQSGVVAKWEVLGERKRECRYYRLTPAGRKQLAAEESNWNRVANAIARVMRVPVTV
jgi:PadR family transcriptional regulator